MIVARAKAVLWEYRHLYHGPRELRSVGRRGILAGERRGVAGIAP